MSTSRGRGAKAAPFRLTEAQLAANHVLAGPARHIMLRGGSRSGKSFLLARAVIIRAVKAPGSSHAVLRFRFVHLKESLIADTMPKVLRLCFPGLSYELSRADWALGLPNGSRILFGGLDDQDRTEKILGQEHATLWLNECSQISYGARNKAVTRLAQNAGLALKAYYDCNPPSVAHWTYRLFEERVEPLSGATLVNPSLYATLAMNPADNAVNLPPGYLEELAALPERERLRFLEGRYAAALAGALWSPAIIERQRVAPADLPDLVRVVVAVDPSGCSGPEDLRSDEIGIIAAGRDGTGLLYVLEDASGRFSPEGWARAALGLYDRLGADRIVAERNFGGGMVEHTLRAVRPGAPVHMVRASRAKAQRAEPVAALYEQGRVRHAGRFPALEEQLMAFSTAGYQGPRSPDRADAAIWALTDLIETEIRPGARVLPNLSIFGR